MRLVIVTGDGPEHRYVANAIGARHEVSAILVCDPPRPRSWHRVLRKSPVRFFDKALRALYLKAIRDAGARSESLLRVLGPESAAFAHPDLVTRVGRPKEGMLARRVAEFSPDVIAVYGTGIIPGEVLALAGSVALNMHTGLSPWYRGVACAFWPLVENEPDKVGATVHECTSAVDGGSIFFSGRAELCRGDDLHAVFARAVKTGAAGYCEVIDRAAAGNLAGEPQDLSLGREYRGAALGFRAERAARRSLRRLSGTWPAERRTPRS